MPEKADGEDVRERKAELRARLRSVRAAIPAEERSRIDDRIASRLFDAPEYRNARAIMTYLSFGDEVDTRAIVRRAWADGKVVALPRCVLRSREMSWHVVTSLEALEESSFGVEEPVDDPATLLPLDDGPSLAVVPGLTFDAAGYRLGYGGGFYDTFLASFHGASAGLCREAQMSVDLAAEGLLDGHDRAVGIVITEGRTARARRRDRFDWS